MYKLVAPQLQTRSDASSSALHTSLTPVLSEEPPASVQTPAKIGKWPCGDELDKRIMSLALPAVLNFAIFPLVGAADTFWVGRMSNALALAGQGAANQVFNSAFWFMSFLPSVITPLVAKAHGAGNEEAVRERVGEAFFIGAIMGIIGTVLLTLFPGQALTRYAICHMS